MENVASLDISCLSEQEMRTLYVASLESQQRNLRLSEAITAANLRFIESGSINQMSQIILEACMTLTNSPFGMLYEILTDGNVSILALSVTGFDSGKEEPVFRDIKYDIRRHGQYVLPRHDSLIFAALLEAKVIIVDSPAENRWKICSCPLCAYPFTTFAGIPLKMGTGITGVICLADRTGGYHDSGVQNFENFVQTCSMALVSARADIDRKAAQEQLRQAQKMEAIGQLAGGIAHDFNNLLTVINGYSTLVIQKIGNDNKVRRDVEQILNAGERAATLVRQLLAFGRRQILEPRQININNLIASLHKILCRLIGEQISLATRLSPDIAPVKADQTQIEQIIMNLVINARDALHGQGGRITLETGNVALDVAFVRENPGAQVGNYVMIAVKDSGMGMPREVIDRIFEPFFTTKEQGYGTGLGLATVYGIVKQSNGYIQVQSEVGIGSEFRVFLPRHDDKWQKNDKPVETEKASSPETFSLQVLVVEDDPAVLDLTAVTLESRGYKVLKASGPLQALKLFDRNAEKIDVIVTDVMMPDMTGPDMAKIMRIRSHNIPIVFMSGYAKEQIKPSDFPGEQINFIMKPFNPEELIQVINSCAAGRGESDTEIIP